MQTIYESKVFPLNTTVSDNNHLEIGGCDIVELAKQFGTPLYVYDERTLRTQAQGFLESFGRYYPNSKVVYACKAFINIPLARYLADLGLGFDVVSGGELAILKAANVDLATVDFHGNNKTPQEIWNALEWGVGHFVIDSFHELELLNEFANQQGIIQRVLVRVSPSIDPHTHRLTTTGVLDSKFGFPIETGQAHEAVRTVLKCSNLTLEGLHFHLGSPIFELEPYTEAIELVLGFAAEMKKEGLLLNRFSPGGGFAIAYTEDDDPPSKDAYAKAITQALIEGCKINGLSQPELTIEPGRSMSGPAGVAVYTVGAIKEIPNVRTYVSVDGGMGDNIRPALYGSQYIAVLANQPTANPTETVTIAGKYCESGDVLVTDAKLPKVKPNDIIAIPASGAYAPSMASTYNMNGKPPIVMVNDGTTRLIRRRESFEDMMSQDITDPMAKDPL
ncbi:MAG: diaminopimelate decarboxylase [Chloroflexi bacterium]|nr:diaminopimelate decarboxylase [Chloroflexota bacterium]